MSKWIRGDQSKDTLHGSKNDDRIKGEGAADKLFGKKGNDWLEGGDGDDTINAGSGDDRMVGGKGDDKLIGGDKGIDTAVYKGKFNQYRIKQIERSTYTIEPKNKKLREEIGEGIVKKG